MKPLINIHRTVLLLSFIWIVVHLGACGSGQDQESYLARVGDQFFTVEELSLALSAGPVLQDSSDAARQILERWITTELLYNEAIRRGLLSDQRVKQQLQENERSILTGALLELMYDEQTEPVTTQDMENYYAQHHDRLAITEPFIRVRYLSSESPDSARSISEAMEAALRNSNPDSTWAIYLSRHSKNTVGAAQLSDSYYPLAQLTGSIPGLENALEAAKPGEVITPFESQGKYHIIQLLDRLEVGAVPDLEMISGFIRSRISIEARKQMIARQVQRLRNSATAREDLVIRE